jgi:hypothetical protein
MKKNRKLTPHNRERTNIEESAISNLLGFFDLLHRISLRNKENQKRLNKNQKVDHEKQM